MNTARKDWLVGALAAIVVPIVVGGCVKREESITVAPDGSVHLKIEVEGDRADMERGAPALAIAPGWTFRQRLATEENGDQKIHRQVETTIAPGRPLPATHPTSDPEGQALAMQHPTTLTIERRPDGVYYHFRRVYEPRASAFVDVWWNEMWEEYREKDPKDMTHDEILRFVNALVKVEQRKQLGLVRSATQSLNESWPQDLLLAVYGAVTEVLRGVDAESVAELLKNEDQGADDGDGALDELVEQLDQDVREAVRETLVDGGLSAFRVDEFDALLERERRRYVITEDYYDDSWEILLKMPGRLVGHNGDEVVDGQVKWERKGEHFYDRTVELLATSVVPHEDH